MSNLLNRLVAEASELQFPDSDPGERYKAQKQLENKIINEICREEATRIERDVRAKGKRRRLEEGMQELKMVLLQCFLLAFLIGLLVNHAYDAMKSLYEQDAMFGYVGVVILVVSCALVAFWMVASKVMGLYRMMLQESDEGE